MENYLKKELLATRNMVSESLSQNLLLDVDWEREMHLNMLWRNTMRAIIPALPNVRNIYALQNIHSLETFDDTGADIDLNLLMTTEMEQLRDHIPALVYTIHFVYSGIGIPEVDELRGGNMISMREAKDGKDSGTSDGYFNLPDPMLVKQAMKPALPQKPWPQRRY